MANRGLTPVEGYEELIQFALDLGEGPGLAELRERIATWTLNDQEWRRLNVLDEYVIEEIATADFIANYLLQDTNAQPLNRWWWHLGKLRAGVYPADLLPANLRAIYQQARRNVA